MEIKSVIFERLHQSLDSSTYLKLLAFEMVLYILLNIPNEMMVYIYAITSPVMGLYCIICSYAAHQTPVNVVSMFSLIWLILVPLTSLPAPMMQALTNYEVRIILTGGIIFSVGGVVSSALWGRFTSGPETSKNVEPSVSAFLYRASLFVVVVSCLALLANFILNGGINLVSGGSETKKTVDAFFGYTFISSSGTVALLILAYARQRRSITLICLLAYVALQLLTGQRWFVVVTILLLASMYSFKKFTRKDWATLAVLISVIIIAFCFISIFRNNVSSFQKYFIDTGRYSGTAEELSNTELIRYIGMSQRNMGTVFSRSFDLTKALQFTLTPLTFLFVKPTSLSLNTNIQAYTANNALSYIYSDAGDLWWLLLLVLSVLINYVYYKSLRNRASIVLRVFWGACVMGLMLSFFAYINAYFYWIGIYPLIVVCADRLSLLFSSKSASSRREV